MKEWRKELLKQLQPKIFEITKPNFHLDSTYTNILGYKGNIGQMTKTIAQIVKPMIDTQEMFKPIFKQMAEFSKSIAKILVNVSGYLTDVLLKTEIPSLSEDEKERIKDSYQIWGKYGWTIIPNIPYSFYLKPPIDIKDANKKALKYCRNGDMKKLFEKMRCTSKIKKSDLEDAIFCFENKKYKPCAMILFALIDSKLIRLQNDEDRSKRNNMRPSGRKAAQNIKNRLVQEENKFYQILGILNLFGCLEIVFGLGNDFQQQPKIINRNFLDHGMLTRKVKRMECVQLFLLYYNFMIMPEWMK